MDKLKRDIIHSLIIKESPKKAKQSLFGSIKAGDVTEKMIEESQRNLFWKKDGKILTLTQCIKK